VEPGDGLDHDGGDGVAVQRDQAVQLVGQLGAVLRLAAAEGVVLRGGGCGAGDPRRAAGAELLAVGPMPPTDMPPKPTPW
jgi:hypothetical protein